MKLDTVHSALCLFSARNSRKQIERATRTRRSRRSYKIHYIPWTVIVSPRWESESKTGLNHRNRLTPIRLHSPAGISFPSDEISFIFFFPHRSSANFRSSTPLSSPSPFFFSHRMPQNWIRSNFEYRLILIFVKTKKRKYISR